MAYDSAQRQITGFIDIHNRDEKVKFSCHLFFDGNFNNSTKISIAFHSNNENVNEVQKGWMEIRSNKKIWIKSDNSIFPCQNMTNLHGGEEITVATNKPYQRISLIKVRKQYLYKDANSNSILKSYLVYSDAVGIIEEKKVG